MKSPTAYYLLLLYTMVIVQPSLPAVSDWWAHEFNTTAHLAQVHAKYGANHLQKEVADAGSETGKNQNTQKAAESAVHILPEPVAIICQTTHHSSKHFSKPPHRLPFISGAIQLPPPKVSFILSFL